MEVLDIIKIINVLINKVINYLRILSVFKITFYNVNILITLKIFYAYLGKLKQILVNVFWYLLLKK